MCLVDLYNDGRLYRCGIDTDMSAEDVVLYWERYSNDVRYVEEREKCKYDIGNRHCSVGVIVYCSRFCDKVGNQLPDHKLKLIKECGVDRRHRCI